MKISVVFREMYYFLIIQISQWGDIVHIRVPYISRGAGSVLLRFKTIVDVVYTLCSWSGGSIHIEHNTKVIPGVVPFGGADFKAQVHFHIA